MICGLTDADDQHPGHAQGAHQPRQPEAARLPGGVPPVAQPQVADHQPHQRPRAPGKQREPAHGPLAADVGADRFGDPARHHRRAHDRTQAHEAGGDQQRRQIGGAAPAGDAHQRQHQQRGADAVEDVHPEHLAPAAPEPGQHVLLQPEQIGQHQHQQPAARRSGPASGRAGRRASADSRTRWPWTRPPGTGTAGRGCPRCA